MCIREKSSSFRPEGEQVLIAQIAFSAYREGNPAKHSAVGSGQKPVGACDTVRQTWPVLFKKEKIDDRNSVDAKSHRCLAG